METTDITDEMKKATKGLRGKKYAQARKVKMAEVEKKCAKGQKNRRCGCGLSLPWRTVQALQIPTLSGCATGFLPRSKTLPILGEIRTILIFLDTVWICLFLEFMKMGSPWTMNTTSIGPKNPLKTEI